MALLIHGYDIWRRLSSIYKEELGDHGDYRVRTPRGITCKAPAMDASAGP
jgi:hypothetical protein